jgi:hypothetical protein
MALCARNNWRAFLFRRRFGLRVSKYPEMAVLQPVRAK